MWGVFHIRYIGFSWLHIVLAWQFLPSAFAFFFWGKQEIWTVLHTAMWRFARDKQFKTETGDLFFPCVRLPRWFTSTNWNWEPMQEYDYICFTTKNADLRLFINNQMLKNLDLRLVLTFFPFTWYVFQSPTWHLFTNEHRCFMSMFVHRFWID